MGQMYDKQKVRSQVVLKQHAHLRTNVHIIFKE